MAFKGRNPWHVYCKLWILKYEAKKYGENLTPNATRHSTKVGQHKAISLTQSNRKEKRPLGNWQCFSPHAIILFKTPKVVKSFRGEQRAIKSGFEVWEIWLKLKLATKNHWQVHTTEGRNVKFNTRAFLSFNNIANAQRASQAMACFAPIAANTS